MNLLSRHLPSPRWLPDKEDVSSQTYLCKPREDPKEIVPRVRPAVHAPEVVGNGET